MSEVAQDDPHTVDVEVASDELREKAPDDYEPICQVSISSGGHVTTFVLDMAEMTGLLRGVEAALDDVGERQDGDRDE
jgi:hypothetical protein